MNYYPIIKKSLWLCVCFFIFLQNIHAGNDEGKKLYYHGIPGCICFRHCSCFCDDRYCCTSSNSSSPQNIVWHIFMKKMKEARSAGPYFPGDLCLNIGYSCGCDCAMLSEYLDGINILKNRMEKESKKTIEFYEKVYTCPKDASKLSGLIKDVQNQLKAGKDILEQTHHQIIPLYNNIFSSCPHKGSYNLALTYNEGLLGFINGDFESSLEKINEFVLFAETSKSKDQLLNSKIYQQQGESLLEIGLYHEAILALTKSLEKDPKNKEAYFSRAAANFEVGDFNSAIRDYISSEAKKEFSKVESKTTSDFSSALLNGVIEGGAQATVDFVPSLCNTAYGLGECLWCFVQAPVDSTINFCNACSETGETVTEYIKNLNQETIEGLADEMKQLYQQFDGLNDSEKGQAIGYCIGKYGVDIFAGGATLKCVTALKNLKNANRVANLEALAASETSRETLKAAALTHAADKELYLKNVKVNWDKQNKHIPGKHNFELGRGTVKLDANEIGNLVKQYVGTGQKIVGDLGSTGYKERIDFGKIIGEYALKKEGQPTQYLQTTKGIITHAKDGTVHIYPSNPNAFID
ncbi:MAG: hypothetical protein H0X29_08395 [Parachlamydiaceae bacterium]|nr:hypothetical protein [Parachlamydiaceae bacterium]